MTREWQLCQNLLKSSQDAVCKLREEVVTCHFYHKLHREELCEATRLLEEQRAEGRTPQPDGNNDQPGAVCNLPRLLFSRLDPACQTPLH